MFVCVKVGAGVFMRLVRWLRKGEANRGHDLQCTQSEIFRSIKEFTRCTKIWIRARIERRKKGMGFTSLPTAYVITLRNRNPEPGRN